MSRKLRYGKQQEITLDIDDERLLSDCLEVRGEPIADPSAAVYAAACEPFEFPPISQATIPGDKVAIALDNDVPQADSVVAGLIQALLEGPIEAEQISVVCAPGYSAEDDWSPVQQLPDSIREKITVEYHDPSDQGSLAFLGPAEDASPVYFNRTVCEADLIVPVGTVRLPDTLGHVGIHGGLYPTFSDATTLMRFASPKSVTDQGEAEKRKQESSRAAWQLGVLLTVQIIPGSHDTILHVLVGEAAAVAVEGERLCRATWRHRLPAKASLVVATIEGGSGQQTWENFARALHASLGIVEQDGAIVLCTELECSPGPALQRLAVGDEDQLYNDIRSLQEPDVVAAATLLIAREQARIYLLSHLDSDTVEDLGVGFVSEAVEVARLSQRHDSCVLLGNAHRALGIITT